MTTTTELKARLNEIHSTLLNLALMLTSDRMDANRLVDETVIDLLERNDRKQIPADSVKGWAFRVMRDLFAASYTRHQPTRMYSIRVNDSNAGSDNCPEGCHPTTTITIFLSGLDTESATITGMYLRGYDVDEIAILTKRPARAVKYKIRLDLEN